MTFKIEENFKGICLKASKVSGSSVSGEFYSWAKNSYKEWFSRFYDINIKPGKEEFVINNIIQEIKSGKTPDTLLIKEPTKDLEDEIKLNFTNIVEQTLMSYDLTGIEVNENYENVKVIETQEDFLEWYKAAIEVFGDTDIRLFENFLEDDEITFLAGYINGEIASTTMVYIQGEVAGLHLVGTAEKYRGKGLGSITTKYALKYAKNRGCHTYVLQASKMGKTIYDKIGFIGSETISHWKYKNP